MDEIEVIYCNNDLHVGLASMNTLSLLTTCSISTCMYGFRAEMFLEISLQAGCYFLGTDMKESSPEHSID